jgi:DNA-binding NarL/FixJ family response regulator
MEKKDIKKKSDQLLKDARQQVGAKRVTINISDREWEAIQSGAISDNKLTQILRYADKDRVKQLAMPKDTKELSPSKKALIKSLSKSYTRAEIADRFGVSVSTIARYMNE